MRLFRISLLLLVATIFVQSSFDSSYASHGASGGGGGCSGDCNPPTIGIDTQGNVRVSEGLTINGESFDVELFSQTIPTQVLKTGQNNTISIKIYENTSPEFFSHIELHFDVYDKVVEGVTVENSQVSMVWDDTGEDIVYAVYGEEEMIKNLVINQEIQNEFAIITFEFEFVQDFKTSTLMTKIWDEKRNSSKNYFYEAFKVIDESKSLVNDALLPNDETIKESKKDTGVNETPAIPSWIKHTAGWWAENKIDDDTFVSAIKILIEEKIILISEIESANIENSDEIPDWIKSTANWWAQGLISDDYFLKGVEFLVQNEIILISS